MRIGGDCEGESERVSNNDLYGNDSVSIQAVRTTRERERESSQSLFLLNLRSDQKSEC